jgi:hypothetical protein
MSLVIRARAYIELLGASEKNSGSYWLENLSTNLIKVVTEISFNPCNSKITKSKSTTFSIYINSIKPTYSFFIMRSTGSSRRGRPAMELNEFQEEISNYFRAGWTSNKIAEHLRAEYDFHVNSRTIQRRLKQWRVSKRVKPLKDQEDALKNQVKKMFFEGLMTDDEMLYVLRKQGFQIGLGGLKNLRIRLNLRRRSSDQQFVEIEDEFRSLVQQELDNGTIEGYGRNFLYTYFRSQQHIISRLVHDIKSQGLYN